MLKNILILILIVILVAIGVKAAVQVMFRSLELIFRIAFNVVLVIAAYMGTMFLIRKMRA